MNPFTEVPLELIQAAQEAGLHGRRFRVPKRTKGDGKALVALLEKGEGRLLAVGDFKAQEIRMAWGRHRDEAKELGLAPTAVWRAIPMAMVELKRYWTYGEKARFEEAQSLGEEAAMEYRQIRRHIKCAPSVEVSRDLAARLLEIRDPVSRRTFERVQQLAGLSVTDAWWSRGQRHVDMDAFVEAIAEAIALAVTRAGAGLFPRTAFILVGARFGIPSERLLRLAERLSVRTEDIARRWEEIRRAYQNRSRDAGPARSESAA